MKSSLKAPKYSACPATTRRQRAASRAITTMSMDMSVGSDGVSLGDCVGFGSCALGAVSYDAEEISPSGGEDEGGAVEDKAAPSSHERRRHHNRGSSRRSKSRSSGKTGKRDAGRGRRGSDTGDKNGEQTPDPALHSTNLVLYSSALSAIEQERGGKSRSRRNPRSGDRSRGKGLGANGETGHRGGSQECRPTFAENSSTSSNVDSSSEISDGSHQNQVHRDQDQNQVRRDRNRRRLSLNATESPALTKPMRQRRASDPAAPPVEDPPRRSPRSPAARVCVPCVGHAGPLSHAHDDRSEPAGRDPGRDDLRYLIIDPTEFDARGRCVRHPHVRLRKKKLLGGGWSVLLSACPNCCVDVLYQLKVRARSDGSPPLAREGGSDGPVRKHGARTASLDGTASLMLSSSGTSSALVSIDRPLAAQEIKTRKPKSGRRDRQEERQPAPAPPSDEGAVMYAANMRYVDEDDRHGIYDGQINTQLVPHGTGTLVYLHDGFAKEGEWRDGRYCQRRGSDGSTSISGGSRRATPRDARLKTRSSSRGHRRRLSCTGEYYH